MKPVAIRATIKSMVDSPQHDSRDFLVSNGMGFRLHLFSHQQLQPSRGIHEAQSVNVANWSSATTPAVPENGYSEKAGNYYCWNRTYDPSIGSWTTPDPAASPFWNLYDYCNDSPTQRGDTTGLAAIQRNGYTIDIYQDNRGQRAFELGPDCTGFGVGFDILVTAPEPYRLFQWVSDFRFYECCDGTIHYEHYSLLEVFERHNPLDAQTAFNPAVDGQLKCSGSCGGLKQMWVSRENKLFIAEPAMKLQKDKTHWVHTTAQGKFKMSGTLPGGGTIKGTKYKPGDPKSAVEEASVASILKKGTALKGSALTYHIFWKATFDCGCKPTSCLSSSLVLRGAEGALDESLKN